MTPEASVENSPESRGDGGMQAERTTRPQGVRGRPHRPVTSLHGARDVGLSACSGGALSPADGRS